jgi:[acyl-carrier-protein] S-malonyltransferase
MGKALAESLPEAADVFRQADSVLGFSLSSLCFDGSDTDLTPTEIAQPALLTCSVAALRCVEARGVRPAAAAGHSLGEYTALVAAGALRFEDALRLVRRRGELMAEAGRLGSGSMAAVLGLQAGQVAELCKHVMDSLPGCIVVPANLNAPGQVVISGSVEGVQRAGEEARAAGARRVIALSVSGAFHSPLMHEAALKMRAELARAPLSRASVPVIANATARSVQSPDEIRSALAAQMESGVRWEESIQALFSSGITHFLELGNGKVLTGLARKIIPGALAHSVSDPAGLDALTSFL